MVELLDKRNPFKLAQKVRITEPCPTCRALGWMPAVRWVMQWKRGKKWSGPVRPPIIDPKPVIVRLACPVCHGWRGW